MAENDIKNSWSSERIASQLNQETLNNFINESFKYYSLETNVKLRILLSSLSIRKTQHTQFKHLFEKLFEFIFSFSKVFISSFSLSSSSCLSPSYT